MPEASFNGIVGTYGQVAQEIGGDTTTYDAALLHTSIGTSSITYIDGKKGILRHRGFDISDLAQGSYLETAFLILNGNLPTAEELNGFDEGMRARRGVPYRVFGTLDGFDFDASPMDMVNAQLTALGNQKRNAADMKTPEGRNEFAQTLTAQMPELAAAAYRHTQGQLPISPREDLDHAQNFYYMCFGEKPSPIVARALDVFFILHADHEQNASTTAAKVIASAGARPYVTAAGAMGALSGGKHGGANQDVMILLQKIADGEDTIENVVARATDPSIRDLVPGLGHRVYKSYDPRADVLQKICPEILKVLDDTGAGNELFAVARQLEAVARSNEHFIKRNIYPNVDFYSGIILKAIGFPPAMFPVLFGVGRSVGWAAQVNERLADKLPIIRPSQSYIGKPHQQYIAIGNRVGAVPDEASAREGATARVTSVGTTPENSQK